MKINAYWEPSTNRDGGQYYVIRDICFARIWPMGEQWQIAVKLPNIKIANHMVSSLDVGKVIIAEAVEQWFNQVDA